LPLAGRFFLDGWTVQGDMMVVFAAAITLAAYNSSRAFFDGLQLNFDLTEKTKQLSAAKLRLEMEIEQRKATEDQLRQAHKMEAVGQLTGGIAHDFNNLLTAVIGHLEMAEDRISGDTRTVALVQAALRAAERGAALTRHLLAFGRRQHLEPRPVDIPGIIEGAAKILKQTIGPEIRLIIETQPGLRPAWADPNQLELAILNLALNARDAMPAGGILQIEAGDRPGECALTPPELPAEGCVRVSVSDTGTGMNQDTLDRAFEPFFTTKEVGRGSGLGLSIVHGFAAQSGGSVRISSTPGNGTRVDLWLPCAQGEVTEDADPELSRVAAAGPAHILVCDDDPEVLALVRSILQEDGYTVSSSEAPLPALELIETGGTPDLLLVDYAMPEMNGIALIDRALACRRGLKVMLMSGHPDVLQAGGVSGIPLLPKPFKVAELRRKIAELLCAEVQEVEPACSGLQEFAVSE
jgi:signal transduction histidine kinase/CheY-like chemotaxis protein